MIEQFKVHRDWALKNMPQKQIDFILEHPFVATADDYNYTAENTEYITEIKSIKKTIKTQYYIIGILCLIIIVQWLIFRAPISR